MMCEGPKSKSCVFWNVPSALAPPRASTAEKAGVARLCTRLLATAGRRPGVRPPSHEAPTSPVTAYSRNSVLRTEPGNARPKNDMVQGHQCITMKRELVLRV